MSEPKDDDSPYEVGYRTGCANSAEDVVAALDRVVLLEDLLRRVMDPEFTTLWLHASGEDCSLCRLRDEIEEALK